MYLTLLNSILLPLAALAGLPLLIHLFARTRPPVYEFSSNEFLRKVVRETTRIKRPKDILLLLLRTLLVASLVMVFLQPLLLSDRQTAVPAGRRNVVVILDATASMAYSEAGQTRLSSAAAQASDILDDLSPNDTANVIWLKARPDAVFPEPGPNKNYLQNALRRAETTHEAGDIQAALQLACRQIEGREGSREIWVVSDFQREPWENSRLEASPGMQLRKVKVGAAEAANAAVTSINHDPARPLAGEEVSLLVDVRNFSPESQRRTVFLEAGETRQNQDVQLPADGRATVAFKVRLAEAGEIPVAVSLNEDGFPADDARRILLPVSEFLRVGIACGESGKATADAWHRALEVFPWARIDRVDASAPPNFDVLLAAGLGIEAIPWMRNAADAGAIVMWMPAHGESPGIAALTAAEGSPPQPAARFARESPHPPVGLAIRLPDDPIFKLFATGGFGDPARAVFKERITFDPALLPDGSQRLINFTDGAPALVRFPRPPGQRGAVYLWNLPLDPAITDWTKQVEFVPFMAETIVASRALAAAGSRSISDLEPGDPLQFRVAGVAPNELRLRQPSGAERRFDSRRDGADIIVSTEAVSDPGFYTLEHGGKAIGIQAVNFPLIESDLRAMAFDDSPSESGETLAFDASRTSLSTLREGIPLWPWFWVAAIAFVIGEAAGLWWSREPLVHSQSGSSA
jgi:hypothetical protein